MRKSVNGTSAAPVPTSARYTSGWFSRSRLQSRAITMCGNRTCGAPERSQLLHASSTLSGTEMSSRSSTVTR